MKLNPVKAATLAAVICLLASPLPAREKDPFPASTKDGLQLQSHTNHGAVYVKPGATLTDYTRVKILDVYVAFEKNWQRNFNASEMDLANQVTDQDMQRIKDKVASEFPVVFTKELEKSGYQVVETAGKDILLLRPAIINLVITAPDVMSPDMTMNTVSSSGSMTLYMELYDSLTSAKIAEVLDAEEIGQNSFNHVANSVSNLAAYDETLEAWAKTLVKRLDAAHGKPRNNPHGKDTG